MYNIVNVSLLRPFLGLYCPSKLIIRLTHDVCFISVLFRIVFSLNQFYLPLFMIKLVNVTLLRQFLSLYCPSKLYIRLTHVVCFISLLFMFFSSLNQFHLPLFKINKVNVTLLRQFCWLVLSFQAYYKASSRCFLNIIIIYDRLYRESISFTTVHDQ